MTVLYEPEGPAQRSVDILFIHGLGGTSLRTWCYNRDLRYLWPQLWLPLESELVSARILSYGYNAHFSKTGEQASLAIGDFASDMLFRMRYAESGPHRLGQVPIIVVAHSMGGLVFKKAFVHGLLNDEFRSIISVIKAVMFMATPHRGSNLADALNKILKSSVFGHSPKDYVAELARRSPTIDELNETFRHHASKVQIFSFYETRTTSIGPMSTIIVDKDSGVLGYPGETVQPMVANHHDVCKFSSRDDPNYASVVGALRDLVSGNVALGQNSHDIENDLQIVKAFCGVSKAPEEDLAAGRAVRKDGTFESFLSSPVYLDWALSSNSTVLWMYSGPGHGKSTLCSLVIDSLINAGKHCCYYFFKHDHLQKRRIVNLLKSFVLQTASQSPRACQSLARLAESGVKLDQMDAVNIWRTLFLGSQSILSEDEHIFWIIDGVDESESGRQLIELLSTLAEVQSCVHLILCSRPQPSIAQAIQRISKTVHVTEHPLSDNLDDIRLAIADEIHFLPSNDDVFKNDIVDQIARKSQGNFLWASLIVKQVVECRRRDQILQVLETAPNGMDSLYDRMLQSVSKLQQTEDVNLAQIFLSWAMYAKRPLTVEEFSGQYKTELNSVMDLKHTIHDLCGQFVTINANNRITLIHHSAKEYLQRHTPDKITLDPRKVHEVLLGKCLVALCDPSLKTKIQSLSIPPFLQYAAMSWVFHLEHCSVQSDRVLNGLLRFFKSQSSLCWIQYMAMGNHLSELPAMSRKVMTYVSTRSKVDSEKPPLLHRTVDLSTIETWAGDLSHIAVKFGRNLSQEPSMIFKCVPALCPASSPIQQQFSVSRAMTLSLVGSPSENWDDCVARVSTEGGTALRVVSSTLYLAIAHEYPRGSVTLWDTTLFQEARTFSIDQRISNIQFSKSGHLLACCGPTRTRVWRVKDGSTLMEATIPPRERVIELAFDDNDTLCMATDLRRVYKLCEDKQGLTSHAWTRLDSALLEETNLPSGVWLGTPSAVAFNHDCTQLAVAYKRFAPTVWILDPPLILARLPQRNEITQGRPPPTSHTGTSHLIWHPSGSFLFGIHGDVFKWNCTEDTYDTVQGEADVTPNAIQCSENGLVFITGDTRGSIKIYNVASMTMLYKLTSEDGTNRMSFSPDSLRFYDIRGSYCNVWEPSCLARIAEASLNRISDADSTDDSFWADDHKTASVLLSFTPSESHAEPRPAIVAVAGPLYCDGSRLAAYSQENGAVELVELSNGQAHLLQHSTTGAVVEHLACGTASSCLALADTYGTISIVMVHRQAGKFQHATLQKDTNLARRCGSLKQLLLPLRKDGIVSLLIHGDKGTIMISVANAQVLAERPTPTDELGRWECSPQHLVCVTLHAITLYDYELKLQHVIPMTFHLYGAPQEHAEISQILGCFRSRFVLLRTVTLHNSRRKYGYSILATSTILSGTGEPAGTSGEGMQVAAAIASAIKHPLGILQNGNIVFLDSALWVCTANPRDETSQHTRHFFVPNDWLTTTGMLLARLGDDGTVLCPSRGKLAVFKSEIGSALQ